MILDKHHKFRIKTFYENRLTMQKTTYTVQGRIQTRATSAIASVSFANWWFFLYQNNRDL